MKQNNFIKIISFSIAIVLAMIGMAFAATTSYDNMTPTIKIISDLNQTLESAQLKTSLPIVFPKKIPADSQIKNYYIFIEFMQNSYIINVDSTTTCQGVHVCNIGSMQAEKNRTPDTYYDMNKKKLTVSVELKNHVKGYFTPSHAMGDFWPAIIQWQQNQTLYTIRWNLRPSQEKAALIQMANDIILGLRIDGTPSSSGTSASELPGDPFLN